MIGSWQQPSLYSSTTKTSSEMDGAWVYLVTGGCGFIGEKIVELLSQQDYVKEVRVFDSVAREEVEKFTTATTHVTVMKGDIRDYNLLLAAMRGVHVVIHTAAIVDYRNTVPFWQMRAVNVGGTENVLRACCVLNIPYVVHTSSIAAVGPNTSHEPMFRGNEDTKYSGEVELPYGKTKAMAEKLVFEANGKKMSNGGKLTTCIIRANAVYGEKAMFLQELYLLTKARNSVLNYLEPENTERNYTYVGGRGHFNSFHGTGATQSIREQYFTDDIFLTQMGQAIPEDSQQKLWHITLNQILHPTSTAKKEWGKNKIAGNQTLDLKISDV
ncbi:3 beta-hydroxysteroid dehydrogenase type 7-like isoform X2 [Grus americana]|uniref:3 beta-hydroxysteroid dehydrogenase type 7-like isoform X2 n=1 Tax=Grus americana TaxID=9117 RepID=UPI0024087406|nr:3 beta-hydroxysteroid dehydrogenase type 7-like isoform X2 [Grus americana]